MTASEIQLPAGAVDMLPDFAGLAVAFAGDVRGLGAGGASVVLTDPAGAAVAVAFVVMGRPFPQGSKRPISFTRKDGSRGTFMQESSAEGLAGWRAAVVDSARKAMAEHVQFSGPVAMRLVLTFKRPTAHYRTGRFVHEVRAGAPLRPDTGKQGDLGKLARAVEDALTDAGVWKDDKQVSEYSRLAKVWAGEDPESLDVPGALIVVSILPDNR